MMTYRIKLICLTAFLLIFLASIKLWGYNIQGQTTLEKLKIVLDELADYDYGTRSWSEDLRHVMAEIYNSPKMMADAERMMMDFFKSDATTAGKQVVCYQLSNIATSKSVPVLSEMVLDKELADVALHALVMIPDESVNKVLRDQLKKAEDGMKAGIIQSIGLRQDQKSVKILEEYAHHPDRNTSTSAFYALGKIGNAQAAKALQKLFTHYTPPIKWEIANHYLVAADQLYESGDHARCFPIYEEVFDANPPVSLKLAALQGMLKDPILRAQSVLINILGSGNHSFIRAVMPVIRDYPGNLDFTEFKENSVELAEKEQLLLMIAFSGRGELEVRPMALQSLENDEPEYRNAGLISLANLGEPNDALTFAQHAAESRGDEKELARKCLYELGGIQTDQIILEAIPAAETNNKVELIRSIGERNMKEAIPLMLDLARNPERSIRLETIRTLGIIGDPEILGELIGLLQEAPGRAERNELTKTITLVADKIKPGDIRSAEILAALTAADDAETRLALIEVLGNIGSDEALPALRNLLHDPNPEIQYATIKALSAWPNDAPVMDLKELVEESEDIKKHVLALQGYVRLLSQSTEVEPDLKMVCYRKIFENAVNAEEQKMILSAVGKSGSVHGLEMAAGLLNDKDLQSEARACFLTLLENVPGQYIEEKRKRMDEALNQSDDENFKDQILEIMNEQN